jgi:hypothetical protein
MLQQNPALQVCAAFGVVVMLVLALASDVKLLHSGVAAVAVLMLQQNLALKVCAASGVVVMLASSA